jgi:hypothetical protein
MFSALNVMARPTIPLDPLGSVIDYVSKSLKTTSGLSIEFGAQTGSIAVKSKPNALSPRLRKPSQRLQPVKPLKVILALKN